MNSQFILVHDKLDVIEDQTTRTNSRVTHLEEDLDLLEIKADKAIADGKHIIDTRVTECPNILRFEKSEKRLEDLEKKLEDAMFFIRHPKILIGSIIALILLSIATFLEGGMIDFIKTLI